MGKVVMYASASVDGFIADKNDQPGPLFDWLLSGDVPLDDSGELKVSQLSYDYVRPYWNEIGATIAGRRVFDLTDGWDGTPPSGIDHVVVVTHRPQPEGWDPEAPFHFVDGVEAAVATAQELAGDRLVEVVVGEDVQDRCERLLPYDLGLARHADECGGDVDPLPGHVDTVAARDDNASAPRYTTSAPVSSTDVATPRTPAQSVNSPIRFKNTGAAAQTRMYDVM